MAEDIKALIDKINREGVLAAEEKASKIEEQAKAGAKEILEKAQSQAEKILKQAQENISLMQEKEKSLLQQAGRDLLLVLRQEINATLDKLINAQVQDALTPESLSKILSSAIKNAPSAAKEEIIVSLNKDDLETLEKGFLAKLKEETKKKITLKSQDAIRAGFVISYDGGKSQFDFSDKALAEYIGNFLKPKLKDILGV
ncbi:MAG: V-type ATP synthase subunit E family protein [Candidatus Omnitrophota bacterium]|jgi:V/A-type H+-transporting ATPase subunit E